MSRTIKRGVPPRRATVKRRPKPRQSRLDWVMQRLPVSEATLKKVATWGVLGIGGVALLAGASAMGVPAMVGQSLGETAGRAGFRYDQVDVHGNRHMNQLNIDAIVAEQGTRSMALIDLERIRQRVLGYGWVQDARVSRNLPNIITVDIVERTPAAVWQDQGRLTLIDKDGVLLDPVEANAIPDLPLVIGPGADKQEPGYQALLAAAPALKPRVRAATWVGNRRWDLRFDSGETLKLPEEGAPAALLDFAKREGRDRLLGRGWLSFDMRDPDKLVARKPDPDTRRQVADPGEPVSSRSGNAGMEG